MGARSKNTEQNTDFIFEVSLPATAHLLRKTKQTQRGFNRLANTIFLAPTLTCSSAPGVASVLLISSRGDNLGIDF